MGNPAIKLRPGEPTDVPDLVSLAGEHGREPVQMLDAFGTDLLDDERQLIVAEVDGVIVGYGRATRFLPPATAPAHVAPAGYYMGGLLVDRAWRRRGIAEALTRARMAWAFERAPEAWYITNARNLASLALHTKLGFAEVTRDFVFPNVSFDGGVGVLGRALRPRTHPPGECGVEAPGN